MSNAAHSREGHGASPWNKGHKVGQKRALRRQDVRKIRGRLRAEGDKRDLALFNLAIDSKLPGCDLVALHINDVWYRGRVRAHGNVVLQRTGLPVRFEITDETRAAIADWLTQRKKGQISYSRADFMRCHTSRLGSMRALSRIGSPGPVLMLVCMARIPSGAPKCYWSSNRLAISKPPNSCSGIRNWKAPPAISKPNSLKLSSFLKRSSCDLLTGRTSIPWRTRQAPSGRRK